MRNKQNYISDGGGGGEMNRHTVFWQNQKEREREREKTISYGLYRQLANIPVLKD